MNVRLDICNMSLNKREEELCGDTVEIIKTQDADMVILSDGMGSGVKANILSTLTTKILGTMLKNGESIEDCVETIAMTLPICQVRNVAYSTFSILQLYKEGYAYLVEYDTPGCIFIRDGRKQDLEYSVREIAGKEIKECRIQIQEGDYFLMMSDGVTHAGVGGMYGFGWGRTRVAEYVQSLFEHEAMTSARIASAVINECKELYYQSPGDDTTVVVAGVTYRKNLSIFTGPPTHKEDDEKLMKDFMAVQGLHVVSGGTSATIAGRVLNKPVMASLFYSDPEIPPTASIEGLDLVTEGVLTLNRTVSLLQKFSKGEQDPAFFQELDADNGASQLAKLIIEQCTHLHLFVGEAMNPAHQAVGLPFDLSIRMRLVDKIIDESRKMGKIVDIKYY